MRTEAEVKQELARAEEAARVAKRKYARDWLDSRARTLRWVMGEEDTP